MLNALVAAYSSPLVPDAGTVVVLVLVALVPSLLVYVWGALALSRVYAKLGIEGWKAWIPVYNVAVLFIIGGLSPWLLLLYLIPFFGQIFVYVAFITAAHRVNVMFGQGVGMTVLAALLFPVWASVLGFGSARPIEQGAPRQAAGGVEDLLGFTPQYAAAADEFGARRDVPAPSAWIPPAPPAPGAPAATPATTAMPIAGAWGEPPLPPAPAAPSAHPYAAADPHAAAPAEPYAAPASDPYAAPAFPAPVVDSYAPPSPAAPAHDAHPAPTADPYAPPVADAPAAPVDDPYVAPASPEPAPVMSWWQPAIVEEEEAAPAAVTPAWVEPETPPTPAAAEPAPSDSFVPPAAPPVLRDSFVAEPDAFPEASGEVSAVAGAPIAGMPRPAAASVAASRPGVGDIVEDTVIASRRRPKWALLLPDGSPMELTGDAVVLGRRPVPVHAAPGAQLVTVVDDTRTVSKTHALLRRRADAWMVSDLDSTNGVVVFVAQDEIDVAPGTEQEVAERFLLGDAELRIVRADA
ncbi:DUF5684 domain-containing protein [Microbacterium sp. BG28]|uniref:DUF5684 domain-containing protein n=1 Tax=Microbacterium sp. BG28 TaxID=3097356 RepID=UPI002A5A0088|nr:DUF5684 domain-containing protein [Microbacterium sp. BG28]MDY0827976.1 DUF5684 domain-containing protein [Microbacterium sp. BG28]